VLHPSIGYSVTYIAMNMGLQISWDPDFNSRIVIVRSSGDSIFKFLKNCIQFSWHMYYHLLLHHPHFTDKETEVKRS
jgi:hypothetical protein